MKIREIILELREYMDRSKYGCWIDAKTNKIYKVDVEEHSESMDGIAHEEGDDPKDPYIWGYEHHFVRVAFEYSGDVNISGIYSDINAVSHILLATCLQPDVDSVYIDYFDVPKQAYRPKLASFPEVQTQRRKLMMFIKGETE